MEDYDKKFTIMLSKHLVEILDNWPVSEARDSLDKIRKVKKYGNSPILLDKAKYEVSYVEPKLFIDPETKSIEYGTVFQPNHRTD